MNGFLQDLTPTQEHFLKKFVLEQRLSKELALFNSPQCLQMFGAPFESIAAQPDREKFPLLRFFFDQYVSSFPFISNNPQADQEKFWKDTVQPFVESVLSKQLSNAGDRSEHTSKRQQINTKLLSGLLLFYNSMVVTQKDLVYLNDETHLKPSEQGKLERIKPLNVATLDEFLDDQVKFVNGVNVNIVSVRTVERQSTGWFSISGPQHHYEFILQVIPEDGAKTYVSRTYSDFKALEKSLKAKFPSIMKAEVYGGLPDKYKHDDSTTFAREKLRLSLRGYMNQLLKFEDIVKDESFIEFISADSFSKLDKDLVVDAEKRAKHEKNMLVTQEEFLKQITTIMIDLTKSFDEFKRQLIHNPNTLVNIFKEIGEKDNIDNLSPLLSVFMEWCKIELASVVFQIFLTQDNSNEMLKNLQKFHSAFPYSLMYNILRFTNPISIISKVINVFLMNLPGSKNKTLLSIIFIMLLDEDISGYEKEIKNTRIKLGNYPNFLDVIENSINNRKLDSLATIDENIVHVLLTTKSLTPKESRVAVSLQKNYKDIKRDASEDVSLEDLIGDRDLAVGLKQFYQLKVRENDKLVLKLLWKEPELTQLLKNFLIIFYQPLIKLLSKAKMHIFFKEFQHFLDELIGLLVQINEEDIYYSPSLEIFNKLKQLFDKHIVIFWRFIHNMYVNDDEQLFIKLIRWIDNFLSKLRLKDVDKSKVLISLTTDEVVDQDLFFKQLNERVDAVIEKRRMFKEFYSKQNEDQDSQKPIDKEWQDINNKLSEYDERFGFNIEELEEFNHEFGNGEHDLELERKLASLETFKHGTSELDKFDKNLVAELMRILGTIENDLH